MLDTQYRMQPDIAEFASQTMYRGLLHSAPDMAQKRQDIVKLGPIADATMAFADLSGMMSVCTKTGNGSRTNVLSALLSFSLALEADEHCEVGMITPYHAQARLLHAMARDAASANPKLKPISCATVHQFQGSEKAMILYDAVDCYRMPYPGLLLTSTGTGYANRLYTVALTRARGKFIGVANIAYMDNKNLSGTLMFARMIESQRGKPSCLSGQVLLQACAASSDRMMRFLTAATEAGNFCRILRAPSRKSESIFRIGPWRMHFPSNWQPLCRPQKEMALKSASGLRRNVIFLPDSKHLQSRTVLLQIL